MGVLTETIKSFDKSQDLSAETREALDLLVEITKAKADEYENEIQDNLNRGQMLSTKHSVDSLYFPISRVGASKKEYRCITSDTPTDLVDTIGASINEMIENGSASSIVTGVCKIINAALGPIMGLSEGMESYCKTTSTFIEGAGKIPNIVRFDCIIWGRAIKAESIKKHMEKALACVAYKSVIDVTKISFSDFLYVYAPLLDVMPDDGKSMQEHIEEAKGIYEVLDGGANIPKTASQDVLTMNRELTVNDLIGYSEPIMASDSSF